MSEPQTSAQRLVEEEEGSAGSLQGWARQAVMVLAIATSLFHLYAAYDVVSAPVLRVAHVSLILSLCFLTFPFAARFHGRIAWWDWVLMAASVMVAVYLISGGDALYDRATSPNNADLVVGVIAIALVLEAVRRASGWIMPVVVGAFLALYNAGHLALRLWAFRAGLRAGREVAGELTTVDLGAKAQRLGTVVALLAGVVSGAVFGGGAGLGGAMVALIAIAGLIGAATGHRAWRPAAACAVAAVVGLAAWGVFG